MILAVDGFTVRWRRRSPLLAAIAFCPSHASAHNFGGGQGIYEDFLSGNRAVFVDLPILLGLIAVGILVGSWKADRLPKVWPFFILGGLAGMVIGLLGVIPPVVPAYVTVCLIGLLAAASPRISVAIMRVIVGLTGITLANAVLSGHTVNEIQLPSYFGIIFALNLGLAVSAGLVTLAHDKLNYGWVDITWRALSSWLVAIAIMAMVLMLRTTS